MFYEKEFIKYLEEKKLSRNTFESYMNDFSRFKSFCLIQGKENAAEVSSDDIELYYEYLKQQSVSLSSVKRHRSSLNCFFSFLMKDGLIAVNPVRDAYKPKPNISASSEVVLTPGEVKSILALDLGQNEKGIRDRAIIELLYASGMKVSELIALKYDAYNSDLKTITFSGRTITLYKSASDSLELYLRDSRPFIADPHEDAMFVNLTGHSITRQGLWKILKGITKAAGIDKKITPRILRRSVAVHMLEKGADREDVEKMLSLSSKNSVEVYIKILRDEESGNSYMRSHPFAENK